MRTGGCADQGAKFHDRLTEIRGPGPIRPCRCLLPEKALRSQAINAVQARDDAAYIAVHNRLTTIERDRKKRACRIAAYAGELPDYLRFERRRAALHPEERQAILFHACLTAAERYNRAGDGKLYAQWLARAARLRPDDEQTLLRLADAEWTAGQSDEAAQHYRRLLSLAPEHPQRGRILERLASTQSNPPVP